MPMRKSLSDPALEMAAAILDDIEKARIANGNRLGQLTRTEPDEDGVMRGFGYDDTHPDVVRLATMVDILAGLEHDAELNLRRALRRHPLHGWVLSMRGVGEKQAARLLAAVGDPYIRPERTLKDETISPAGPRTVSALWAYCGLHVVPGQGASGDHELTAGDGGDPGLGALAAPVASAGVAPRRQRGKQSNWSMVAKTRAILIAQSCLKQLRKPCTSDEGSATHTDECTCSPYRLVYDRRRAHTAKTHPEWLPVHRHNDAMRVSAKEIVKDLWCAAKAHYDAA